MDIGGPYTPDIERFHVVINGKAMRPVRGEPYRFTRERAEREAGCTELNSRVQCENIRIVPVDLV